MKLFGKKTKQVKTDNFPPIGGLMVSKMIVDEHKKVRFMYRNKRCNSADSGWNLFSGFETEDYMNNPDNFGVYAPSTIVAIDPSIAELLLKGGIGSVFERKTDMSPWCRVTDYPLEDDYMVRHRLTEEWELEINNLFERKKEENGDLLYTTGDKSLRLTIWSYENEPKDLLCEEYKQTVDNANAIRKFDFSDNKVTRIGYLTKESDTNKEYNVIYGFSIVENEVILSALYFDEEESLEWAIETWKRIKLLK